MISYFRRHKLLVISLAVALVLLVIGGVVTARQIAVNNERKAPIEQVNDSAVGSAINEVIPEAKNASSMVAPATEDWWDVVSSFTPSYELDNVNFNSLPKKPSQLGWTVTFSETVKSDYDFGLNAVFLTFSNEEDAVEMQTWLGDAGNNKYQTFTVGNLVVIAPSWSTLDNDFLVDGFSAAQSESVAPDKGYWKVDFGTLRSVFVQDEDAEVYEDAVSALGFKPDSESVWYASSEDGLSWKGQLSEGSWDSEGLDPLKFNDVLSATMVDQLDPNQSPIPEGSSGDIQYLTDMNQAAVLEFVAIQTNEYSAGYTTDLRTGEQSRPEKLEDSRTVKFSINPNAWFSLMSGRDDIPGYFSYDLAEITLYTNNSNMDITFVKPA